jgi:signal peptidase I
MSRSEEPKPKAAEKVPRTRVEKIKDTVRFLVWVLVLTMVLRVSVAEAYRVEQSSMENTVLAGDTVLGNKFLYGARLPLIGLRLPAFRSPHPGDVIVFKSPIEKGRRLVKRVIAVEGQTVEVRDKQVVVDGSPVALPETAKHEYTQILPGETSPRDNLGPLTVPEDHLFVMGDNRDVSLDSRAWGFLDEDLILGHAMFVLYSWNSDDTRPFWQRIRWSRIGHILR